MFGYKKKVMLGSRADIFMGYSSASAFRLFFSGGAPATTMTISPFGSCSLYHAETSASVPRLCSSWILEISRATEHSRSGPKCSMNWSSVLTSLYGDS